MSVVPNNSDVVIGLGTVIVPLLILLTLERLEAKIELGVRNDCLHNLDYKSERAKPQHFCETNYSPSLREERDTHQHGWLNAVQIAYCHPYTQYYECNS